jgi:hypothetical protein
MEIIHEVARLKSGKTLTIEGGIIGINADFRISEGFDSFVDIDKFNQNEMIEIADYMIDLWSAFRNRLTPS